MASSSSFRTRAITGILLVVLSFGVAYFVATPMWNKYTSAKHQLVKTRAEIASLNQSLSQVEHFISTYEANTSNIDAVNLALPAKTSDTANLVSGLNDLAKSSGIALGDLTLEELVNAEKQSNANSIQVLKVNMLVSGTYESFEDFVLRLENHLRISNIQKVTFSAGEDGLLTFGLSLETYYQK